MVVPDNILKQDIWIMLENIPDPEIPVLSIVDLGIVRDVEVANGDIEIRITPTYSGCPAIDAISATIRMQLLEKGFMNPRVSLQLSPAWTTDWMKEEAKQKLKAYGIAPPNPRQQVCHQELFAPHEAVQCPRCDSYRTERLSEFGSTPCKSLYQCSECHETFDYFKCH
jgi:ring-1,2-phenylacetyl-CoA epoxidase subunit PaaD